jgi:protein TonB
MKEARRARTRLVLLAAPVAILLAACGSPPTTPAGPASAPARPIPGTSGTESASVGAVSSGAAASVRLAPRDPTMERWKQRAAERIHEANQKQLFEGRPHHLLQAVIVVEVKVDKSGNVVSSKVTRSPRIKKLDDMAIASLKAASPLPVPPPALLVRGNLVYSETWLVQNDGTFRVRTLAMPQQ